MASYGMGWRRGLWILVPPPSPGLWLLTHALELPAIDRGGAQNDGGGDLLDLAAQQCFFSSFFVFFGISSSRTDPICASPRWVHAYDLESF